MSPPRTLPPSRDVARVCLVVAATFAGLWLCWELRHVIKLAALAVLVAVALGPPVELLARRLPRPAAIAVVYVTIVAAVGVFVLLSAPSVIAQLRRLSDSVPAHLAELRDSELVRRLGLGDSLGSSELWQQRLGDVAGTVQSLTVAVGSLALQTCAVAALSFLLLLEAPKLAAGAARLLDSARHQRLAAVTADIYRSVGGYVAGMFILATFAGSLTWMTLTLAGVPFALPLALLCACLNLVPLLGATVGGLTVAAFCLAYAPHAALVWLAVFFVYQQIENSLLAPLIYRRTVKVHPLIVIVSLLAGATLMGALGALLAIPAAACAQIVTRDWWAHRTNPVTLGGLLDVTPPAAAGLPITPSSSTHSAEGAR